VSIACLGPNANDRGRNDLEPRFGERWSDLRRMSVDLRDEPKTVLVHDERHRHRIEEALLLAAEEALLLAAFFAVFLDDYAG
jgi:hypothetical protein